jgi:hypothetical protein
MAINVEEHTITQSVLAPERPAAWKALQSFAEYRVMIAQELAILTWERQDDTSRFVDQFDPLPRSQTKRVPTRKTR